MAHIFITDGIRVVFQAENPITNQLYQHVFGVKVEAGPPSYADCVAVNAAFQHWWDDDYKNMVNTDVRMRQIVSTGMNSVPAAQATLGITTAGLRGGEMPPANVSFAVKATTHLSGRSNRGRKFVFPFATDDLVRDDSLVDVFVLAEVGVFNSCIARLADAGYTLAVPSLHDAAMKPIARFVAVDSTVDSMRRRLAGRGR